MSLTLLVLRVIHVVGGVIWAGTAIFVAVFLLPSMGDAGPAGAPVMAALTKRKLFVIVPIIAVLTMAAGIWLLYIASDGFHLAYFSTRHGATYLIGGSCAVLGFLTFLVINNPALARMGVLQPLIAKAASDADRGPLLAELGALRARAGMGTRITATLLFAAALAMALGRYVG